MQDLLELLLELQTLDRVPRSGYSLRGVPEPESVSAHTFHTVFLVWSLAPRVPEVDARRAMELALVHDLAEVRMGDLPRSAAHYLPAGAKRAGEAAAAEDLLAPLGDRGTDLFAEYQAGETLEARFVSACDKLQLLLKTTVYESWGQGDLEEFWPGLDSFADGGFPVLRQIAENLYRRRET